MGYHQLTQKEKEKILKKIEKFFRKFRWVKACIVFGSFITRSYFEDIDIAIVTRRKLSFERLAEIALQLEKEIGFEVDLKLFSELEDSLKFEVLRKGKVLFGSKSFVHYKYDFVRKYLDFVEWWKAWIRQQR